MDELEHMTAEIERLKDEIDKRKGAAMMEVPQLEEREDSNQKPSFEVVFISDTTQTEKIKDEPEQSEVETLQTKEETMDSIKKDRDDLEQMRADIQKHMEDRNKSKNVTDWGKYELEQRQLLLNQHEEEIESLRQKLQVEREVLDEVMNDIQNKHDILKSERDQLEKIRVEFQREKDTEGYWITQLKE